MRDDLFTVAHELFMTDTARYADIVFVSSSFANLSHLLAKEVEIPWIEIHPEDAHRQGITGGAMVEVANTRVGCGRW